MADGGKNYDWLISYNLKNQHRSYGSFVTRKLYVRVNTHFIIVTFCRPLVQLKTK